MKITGKVEGMMCGRCESHVNNAVRRAFPAAKVTSSHNKGETVSLAEAAPEEERLRQVIEAAGYTVGRSQSALRRRRASSASCADEMQPFFTGWSQAGGRMAVRRGPGKQADASVKEEPQP